MSLSEYAQIMKEMGLTASSSLPDGSKGNSTNDKIFVEHKIILDASERVEKILKGTILGLLDLGRHVVDTWRIVAIAGSIGFVMWGCSSLIASYRIKQPSEKDRT